MAFIARFIIFFAAILGCNATWALEEAVDLHAAGVEARQRKVPVMVVFAAKSCGFCERLEAEHVDPMMLQHEYSDHLVVLRVTVDRSLDLQDFNGMSISPDAFAKQHQVRVTPTVILFDYQGHALTKKLEGYTNPAFYGAYLDDAIAIAQSRLN